MKCTVVKIFYQTVLWIRKWTDPICGSGTPHQTKLLAGLSFFAGGVLEEIVGSETRIADLDLGD
jgi:hypothetical protein